MTALADAPQRLPGAASRVSPVAAGWAACLCLYGAFGVWLLSHPVAVPSDDALFFARGLLDFDVLDFSPQFPGYPGFVGLGRLILPLAGDPVAALFDLTIAIALALPPAAALIAWRAGGGKAEALAAFAVTLTVPLLPDLALSLLSDGSGILFLLASLALLPAEDVKSERGRASWALPWLSGAALGFAVCCRPSDAALFAGAFLALAWRHPRHVPAFLGGAGLVVLPTLAVIYAVEGRLYLWEARHFISGHATGWGNTVFAAGGQGGGWLTAIAHVPGGGAAAVLLTISAVIAIGRCRTLPTAVVALAFAFVAHAVWVALMQNPDHLRHLAPLSIAGGLIVVMLPLRPACGAIGLLLGLHAYTLARTLDPMPAAPPLARAADYLATAPGAAAVAVNDGVAVLRERLSDLRVYDMQDPAHARLGLAAARGRSYLLSTTPLPRQAAAVFPSRVLGEPTMYLYGTD